VDWRGKGAVGAFRNWGLPMMIKIKTDDPATKPGVAGVASFGQLTLKPTA
jgi:hypothetical protein